MSNGQKTEACSSEAPQARPVRSTGRVVSDRYGTCEVSMVSVHGIRVLVELEPGDTTEIGTEWKDVARLWRHVDGAPIDVAASRTLNRSNDARHALEYTARVVVDGGPDFSIPVLLNEVEARSMSMFDVVHARAGVRATITFEPVAAVPRALASRNWFKVGAHEFWTTVEQAPAVRRAFEAASAEAVREAQCTEPAQIQAGCETAIIEANEAGIETGLREERDAVLTWLRSKYDEDPNEWWPLGSVANAIKHGMHRRGEAKTCGAERLEAMPSASRPDAPTVGGSQAVVDTTTPARGTEEAGSSCKACRFFGFRCGHHERQADDRGDALPEAGPAGVVMQGRESPLPDEGWSEGYDIEAYVGELAALRKVAEVARRAHVGVSINDHCGMSKRLMGQLSAALDALDALSSSGGDRG